MKTNKKKVITFIISIAVPLAVGGVAALLTGDAMKMFDSMEKPPLAPPAWLFPVAWTILYIFMGIACYLLLIIDPDEFEDYEASKRITVSRRIALLFYCGQLIFNFFWSLLFFRAEMYYTAFIWLMIMWLMIAVLIKYAKEVRPAAAYILIPYIIWCTFAGYLNIMIAIYASN